MVRVLAGANNLARTLVLPPTRKKSRICIFVVESLSFPGKSMSITKLSGKIGLDIFPDFKVP